MNQLFSKRTLGFLVLVSVYLISTKTFAQPGGPSFMRGRTMMEMHFPLHRHVKSIAYGNNIFVAVGPGMTILSSKDGKHWINYSSEITNLTVNINFTSQTYATNGDAITFVSFADMPQLPSFPKFKTNTMNLDEADRGALIRSTEQKMQDYQSKFPTTPLQLSAVTFGGGTFVIVGDYGEILTSRDGKHWTSPISGSSDILTDVVWGDSGFVAVGDKGTILTSTDGSVWTRRNSGTDQALFGVAYGNGTFVALGDNSTILTSIDGINWTSVDIGSEGMEAIAFGNGIFMGTSIDTHFPGKMYLDGDQTMVSTDGKNWHEVRHPYPLPGQTGAMTLEGHSGGTASLTFVGGLFVATSFEGVYTSKDGHGWSPSLEPFDFAIVGNGSGIGTNQSRTSWPTIVVSKGSGTFLWDISQSPPSRLLWGRPINDKTFRLSLMEGMGFPVSLLSTNGETWTTPDRIPINGSVHGNQVVYFSGKMPVVLTSEDGIVWTRLKPRNSDQPTPIVASNNQNAVISENGVVFDLNGQPYKLNLAASIGQLMEVQASTNLVDWVMLTTVTNSGAILNFIDPDAKNYPQRFYRLKLQ